MDKYIQQINDAVGRYNKWKQNDETIVFTYLTDLHSALETTDRLNSQKRETVSHILLMNEAAKQANADFTANLGDCGIDVPLKTPEETAELTDKLFEYHNRCVNKPVLCGIGNHDIKMGFTPEFWGKFFQKINKDISIDRPTDGSYGFYDVPGKKARIFFLFCNETENKHSDTQLNYLDDNLRSMPKDWCAVILQHICIRQKGHWRARTDMPPFPQFIKMHNILSDFVRDGGRIAGVFSGDSHFNLNEKSDGVFYFSSQGYGGAGPSEAPDHALRALEVCPALGREDSFDSEKFVLIELVAIKYQKRETAVFRIGAGGETFDVSSDF